MALMIDTAPRRLALGALLCAALATGARAEDDIEWLETRHGILEMRESEDASECEPGAMHPCEVVTLEDAVVRADHSARIMRALPSPADPRIVAIRLHGGGARCPGAELLLDFTAPRLVVVEGFGLDGAELRDDGTLVLRRPEGRNELGDELVGVYHYAPGSGRPALARRVAEYPVLRIGEDTYPEDILGDPDLRRPLVDALGTGGFAAFREDLSRQSPVTILEGRILVGEGCNEDDCESAGGIFAIDRKAGIAVALHQEATGREGRRIRGWGDHGRLGPLARAALEAWLEEMGAGWGDVVPARR